MEICTIGFTKHSAHSFFEILRAEDVKRLVDVRLNNVSQLAGFAKRDDLSYFLKEILWRGLPASARPSCSHRGLAQGVPKRRGQLGRL